MNLVFGVWYSGFWCCTFSRQIYDRVVKFKRNHTIDGRERGMAIDLSRAD
jgi:hypothetical protein